MRASFPRFIKITLLLAIGMGLTLIAGLARLFDVEMSRPARAREDDGEICRINYVATSEDN